MQLGNEVGVVESHNVAQEKNNNACWPAQKRHCKGQAKQGRARHGCAHMPATMVPLSCMEAHSQAFAAFVSCIWVFAI